MSTTPTTVPAAIASAPPKLHSTNDGNINKIWILFYRHGMNPQLQKGFYFEGDLRAAVERAKKHCELMGYRYIFVRPFVCDLTDDEISRIESRR